MTNLLTIREICAQFDVSESTVVEFVDCEVISPIVDNDSGDWHFSATEISWLKKALRLRQDLELDSVALSMVINLLQRQEKLESENLRLRQQLQRFLAESE